MIYIGTLAHSTGTQNSGEPTNCKMIGVRYSLFMYEADRVRQMNVSILAVDDSAAIRHLIQETLQLAGFHVILAKDGRDALQMLETHPEIELIIADVFMPVMNGMTLVSLVRDSNKTIPIITISSLSDPDLKQRMLEVGATAWFSKPLHPVKLLAIVKESLKHG